MNTMNLTRGFAPIVIIIVVAVALGGGWYFAYKNDSLKEVNNEGYSEPISVQVVDYKNVQGYYFVRYSISGSLPSNTKLSLMERTTTTSSIEALEIRNPQTGTSVIDFRLVDKLDFKTRITPGDYFLRLSNLQTGAVVANSADFNLSP